MRDLSVKHAISEKKLTDNFDHKRTFFRFRPKQASRKKGDWGKCPKQDDATSIYNNVNERQLRQVPLNKVEKALYQKARAA